MSNMLMIIDPQVDFITGSMRIEGAEEKINALIKYIRENSGKYSCIAVTVDWHPFNHCSFLENGGPWPAHCVQHTVGAAIYPPLADFLYKEQQNSIVKVYKKGDKKNVEEYSLFRNLASTRHLDFLIRKYDVKHIDVCGIAGDICVLNTLKAAIGIYRAHVFNVLEEFCPSTDGGIALHEFLES